MIRSITFKEGGYITQKSFDIDLTASGKKKLEKLEKRGSDYFNSLSVEGKIRQGDLVKDKDYSLIEFPKNPHLLKTLLGRKFEFSPDKINVIFGPNASGKSTIIKTLASHCGCGDRKNLDGWTSLLYVHPSVSLSDIFDENKKSLKELYQEFRDKRNTYGVDICADIEWDGVPVYNDNFSSRKAYSFGDLCGSIFSGENAERDELLYAFAKKSMSLGQNSMLIFNKVFSVVSQKYTYSRFMEGCKHLCENYNDVWQRAAKLNIMYYNEQNMLFGKPGDEDVNTVMFDELDKSIDIMNTAYIYNTLLPKIKDEMNVQIIIVSHSPLILSDNVYGNKDVYNIINIDDEYTESCLEQLKQFKF